MRDILKILHLDSERTWRGGENQMLLLTREAHRFEACEFHLAAPEHSEALRRLEPYARPVAVSFAPLALFPSAAQVAKYVRLRQIQVLDAQSSKAHSLGLLVKRLVPEVKLVVHRRVDNQPGRGFFNRRKYLSPFVDRYVAISQAIQGVLTNYGVPESRITVVRSAVTAATPSTSERQAARAKICVEVGFDPNRPIIAMIGYMTEQRGHEVLIKALGLLKAKGQSVQCLLAGDGPLRAGVEAEAHRLGLMEQLRFLGVRNDVPTLMAGSDILAMPSNYEGLGTTILDALHSGLAVAATRIGGIPEMIRHEETGLLSPVGDAEALSQNLARLLNDAALRVRLNAAGKAHIDREFSLEQMVRGNLAVYRSVLAR